MTRITKATEKRLQDCIDNCAGPIFRQAYLLQDIIKTERSQREGWGDNGLYTGIAINTDHGLICTITSESERRILMGLHSRYESLIDCTFTHGNNQCTIHDINKLAKKILA